jgi:hypothetical protein
LIDRIHEAPLKKKNFTLYYIFLFFRKVEPLMKIKVESQSDSKGRESPTSFTLGTRIIQVEACVDCWHGEQACYFRVLGSDENSYILKGPLEDGSWELVSFTHKDSRGTELEYEGKRELQ